MARPLGERRADRPARRPRRPGGAPPARAGPRGLRARPAAPAAAGALRRRARLRARPGDRAPDRRGRAARGRRPPASACSASCAGWCSRPACWRAWPWPTASVWCGRCCPSWPSCTRSSRATTTTSTSTATRSRCWSGRSSSRAGWRSFRRPPRLRAAARRSRWPTSSRAAEALRFGALLHDIGKPATRARARRRPRHLHGPRPGRGGDGARSSAAGCAPASGSAASWRALTRHHLRARLPRARAAARPARRLPLPDAAPRRWRWRSRCSPAPTGSPPAAATPTAATAAHLELARELMRAALDWREQRPAAVAAARATSWPASSASSPDPSWAGCWRELQEAAYAGEATDARPGAGAGAQAARESRT